MRQGQQGKRPRGRGRKNPNPLTRSYESNGGDVKIRGTALHIAEKYQQLARDSQASGDRVGAENYLQHAEHYFRIVSAAQQQQQQQQAARAEAGEQAAADNRGNGAANGHTNAGDGQDQQPAVAAKPADETAPDARASAEAGTADEGSGEAPPRRAQRGPRRRQPYRDREPRTEASAPAPDAPQPHIDES